MLDRRKLFALLLAAACLPQIAAAVSVDFLGGNGVVLCPCESADASFTVAGQAGEQVFLEVLPQDGEFEIAAPSSVAAGGVSRMRFKASCSANAGRKFFETVTQAPDESRREAQLFSIDIVACHSLKLRLVRAEAQCPNKATYFLELENNGKAVEEVSLSSNADFGYASLSPNQFVIAPGETISAQVSVLLPPELAVAPKKQIVEIRAESQNAAATRLASLVTPLCPQPTLLPQLVVVQQAFPALPPGGLAEIARVFSEINSSITGFFALSPAHVYALLALMALMAVAFYALSHENELESQRRREEKRRKARSRFS